MRALAGQVDEVQFTLDTTHRRTSRFKIADFQHRIGLLRKEVTTACSALPNARVVEIDFSQEKVRELSSRLPGSREIPLSAYDGSPFYGYIFGLLAARSKYVLHIDADMLFGGGSQSWVREAVDVLEADGRILAINPLAGPPTEDGEISQPYVERISAPYPAFTFKTISTRIFLAERERLLLRHAIPYIKVHGRRRLQAAANNLPAVRLFEDCLSELMSTNNYLRLDMLGREGGLWSLHPPYRSESFYATLPEIVERVESGEVPRGQRGDYDLNDSMIDWSDVRRKNGLGAKLLRYSGYAGAGIRERIFGR